MNKAISVLVLLALVCGLAIQVIAVPGDLDETYGTTGFYSDDLPDTQNNEGSVFVDGAMTDDGKLVVVGWTLI